MSIVTLEPGEEKLFTDKMNATVISYDAFKKPYLKRFTIGKCNEECPEIQKIFNVKSVDAVSIDTVGI